MKQSIIAECSTYLHNYNEMAKDDFWGSDMVRLAAAGISIVGHRPLDTARFQYCRKLLKAREGIFSSLRGMGSTVYCVKMAMSDDPEAYLEQLQASLMNAQQRKEQALAAKTVAAGRLEGYQEGLDGDPRETFEAAQRRLDEQKELLGHWMHIKEVFLAQKEQLGGNPMVELAARFQDNLRVLSGSRVTSEFPDADRLQMQIYSNNRAIDFAKLSEGTKETVSLSFRLAMLDHLFPEGGGIIVLDDPFANMDVERTALSCALLKDVAARHQVLFLTCKEDYMDLLGGNGIRL